MEVVKKLDGRKNNKGHVGKAGRKSKAEELKTKELGTNAIIKVYGSLEEYWEFIAEQSQDSLPHLKLLSEYVLGKPVETKVTRKEDQRFFSEDNPKGEQQSNLKQTT